MSHVSHRSAGAAVPEAVAAHVAGAHLGIWTTTPWTIPANLAVAVNADLQYAVVEVQVRYRTADVPPTMLPMWSCLGCWIWTPDVASLGQAPGVELRYRYAAC
jgi:hypothetical protein